jgi:hypothetical protein
VLPISTEINTSARGVVVTSVCLIAYPHIVPIHGGTGTHFSPQLVRHIICDGSLHQSSPSWPTRATGVTGGQGNTLVISNWCCFTGRLVLRFSPSIHCRTHHLFSVTSPPAEADIDKHRAIGCLPACPSEQFPTLQVEAGSAPNHTNSRAQRRAVALVPLAYQFALDQHNVNRVGQRRSRELMNRFALSTGGGRVFARGYLPHCPSVGTTSGKILAEQCRLPSRWHIR